MSDSILRDVLDRKGAPMAHTWRAYRCTDLSEMRPYVPGEDLTHIAVPWGAIPTAGGMIARHPARPADQWYVAPAAFVQYCEAVTTTDAPQDHERQPCPATHTAAGAHRTARTGKQGQDA